MSYSLVFIFFSIFYFCPIPPRLTPPASPRSVRFDASLPTVNVPVSTAVTFVYVPSSSLTQYLPPVPPTLPQMPADVLYPLYVGAAPASTAMHALGMVALGAAAVMAAGLVF